ncbi:MAG: hypothetical protein ABH808_00775 [Candidatus Kuenenbacteria bacterium]
MEINIEIWQIVLGLIIIAIGLLIFFKFVKIIKSFFRGKKLYGIDKEEIKKKWQEIEGLLNKSSEISYKLAILEADKLLDHVLKSMFFPGNTLGERLKVACYKYEKLRQVWWAHKVRNQLVHETNYHLAYGEAKKALNIFKKGFEELGIL